MVKVRIIRWIGILVLGIGLVSCMQNERPDGDWHTSKEKEERPLFTTHFPPEEFSQRRNKVFDAIGEEAIAVIAGAPSPDGYEHFRQNNEFYYLSGIESPHSYLILNGKTRTATVFLPQRKERREYGEGKVLSAEDDSLVKELSGIDEVRSTEKMETDLQKLTNGKPIQRLYTYVNPYENSAMTRSMAKRKWIDVDKDPLDNRVARYQHLKNRLQEKIDGIKIEDLSPIIDELRKIKSERELALIRESTKLHAQVIKESIRSTEVGVTPAELEAVGKFIYQKNGYQGDAYYALVHVGPDAYMNHYHGSVRPARDGDMLLMDYGNDYNYYTSDLARMWPANGRFNKTQKELYSFYLEFYEALLYNIEKGLTPQEIKMNALVEIDSLMNSTSFSKPRFREAAESFVSDFRASTENKNTVLGHGVGMAPHDVGDYTVPLEEGMVFVIEPQFRVPEDNIYIRLEDMILVTEEGVEIMSDFLPRDIEGIEQIMREDGLLQVQLKR